jgi:hypothetical protein
MFKIADWLVEVWQDRELEKNKEHLAMLLRGHNLNEDFIKGCVYAVYLYPKLSDHERWVISRKLGKSQQAYEKEQEASCTLCYAMIFQLPDVLSFLMPDENKAAEAQMWGKSFLDEYRREKE